MKYTIQQEDQHGKISSISFYVDSGSRDVKFKSDVFMLGDWIGEKSTTPLADSFFGALLAISSFTLVITLISSLIK